MFKQFLAYLTYRRSILAWAKREGYGLKDISFFYPWTPSEYIRFDTPLVVFFDIYTKKEIDTYICIYKTHHVEIYERPLQIHKLRYGIPTEIFSALSGVVREYLVADTQESDVSKMYGKYQTYEEMLHEVCTVYVVLWMDGHVRGNKIIARRPLMEAVQRATRELGNDQLYKPPTRAELEKIHIELVVVPELWLPTTYLDGLDTRVSAKVATRMCASFEKGPYIPVSYFMPTLFNRKDYGVPKTYFSMLQKKASIQKRQNTRILFEMAPTFQMIELTHKDTPLTLLGNIPIKNPDTQMSPHELACILARHIDVEGYAPNIIPVESHHEFKLDVLREALAYAAFAEYSFLSGVDTHENTMNTVADFVNTNLTYVKKANINCTLCYMGHGEVFTNKSKNSVREILDRVGLPEIKSHNRIYLLQIAKLFLYTHKKQNLPLSDIQKLVRNIYEDWERVKETSASPVHYADLLLVLEVLGMHNERDIYLTWLTTLQTSEGSFFESPQNRTSICASRATAKIAEASIIVPEARELCRRALKWCERLQYTEAIMYHISLEKRGALKGGFRTDYWNRDVFIDGISHALLATARLEYYEKYRAHWQTCLQ